VSTRRPVGPELRALGWYRQFRETVLMFAAVDIESLYEPL